MMRVRAHNYKKIGNVWTPFLHDGRQVQLVAQPGAQEAWLALPEQEGLFSGPRGTGKTVTAAATYLQHVGTGYGASWKGIWFRHSMTGHVEAKALLEAHHPADLARRGEDQHQQQHLHMAHGRETATRLLR